MSNTNVKSNKINIVLGSHGSGKSTFINDKIFDIAYKTNTDGNKELDLSKKIFLIVPEQDNFMKQKEIITYDKNIGKGILNIDIVSFERLCYLVFEKSGEEYNYAEDDLKVLILRLAINELIKEKNEFKYFDFKNDNIGIYEKIKSALSEFSNYAINETTFDEIYKKINDNESLDIRNKNKLYDLKIIQKKYYEILNKNNYKVSEEKLSLLNADNLRLVFNDAYIFFDGFTGFTPLQREVYKNLLSIIKESYISIDLRLNDSIKDSVDKYTGYGFICDNDGVFDLSIDYIKTIEKAKNDANIKDKINFILMNGDGKCIKYNDKEDFKLIEENIFNDNKLKNNFNLKNITINKAIDIDNEIDKVANTIIELTNENYKYNDIKIIASDINVYKNVIIDTFNKKNIPLFIDDSKDVLDSPLISSVKNLLDVMKYNFMNDTVIKYIKSGLYEFNNDLFVLDNIVKKYNIFNLYTWQNRLEKINEIMIESEKKHKTNEEIKNEEIGIEDIIELKNRIIKPLINCYEKIGRNKENKISIYIDAINSFLNEDEIKNVNEKFIESINDSVDNISEKILNDSRVLLEDIINKLKVIAAHDDREISIDVFKDLFNLCLKSIKYKTIPMMLDQVVAGDLIRSRYNNPKIVFFIGMNESLLPPQVNDTDLINDEIRDIFSEYNHPLSFTSFNNTINTKFYTYLSLTSPKDKLYISYSDKNSENHSDFKSYYLNEIEDIFKSSDSKNIINENKLDNLVLYNEKELNEFIRLNGKSVNDDDKKEFDSLSKEYNLNSFSDINMKKVKPETIKSLMEDKYGKIDKDNKMIIDATGIEAYEKCRFKFFAERLLSIKKREVNEIEDNLIGNVNHEIMKKIDDIEIENNNNEINEKLENIKKNRIIDKNSIDDYLKNDKKNIYKIDSDKLYDILNVLNDNAIVKINDLSIATIKYDLNNDFISMLSIESIIDLFEMIIEQNDDEAYEKFLKCIENNEPLLRWIKDMKKASNDEQCIKNMIKDLNGYDINEFKDKIYKRLKMFININGYKYTRLRKLVSSPLMDDLIKYFRVPSAFLLCIKKYVKDDVISEFLKYLYNTLVILRDNNKNKMTSDIRFIVNKITEEEYDVNFDKEIKTISLDRIKNSQKFYDTKLGAYFFERMNEVLIKTLYYLFINNIYKMDFKNIKNKTEERIKDNYLYAKKLDGEKSLLDVYLNGRIDKFVVGSDDNNNIYIEIIDYKSSKKRIELDNNHKPKNLDKIQTLLYLTYLYDQDKFLKTLMGTDEKVDIIPIGALYQGIYDEYMEKDSLKPVRDQISDSYKMTGILNKDTINIFEKGLNYYNPNEKNIEYKLYNDDNKNILSKNEIIECIEMLRNMVSDKLYELKEGNVLPSPVNGGEYSICEYCNLKSLCMREEKFDTEE